MPIKEDYKFEIKFKRPELFRDDLEKIEKIIVEQLKPRGYSLKFDKFGADKVEDLPKKGSSKSFSLYAHDPSLSLYFSKYSASVSTENNNIIAIGAVSEIGAIISKRQRKILSITSKIGYLFFLLIPSAILIDTEKIKVSKMVDLIFSIVYLVAFILWGYVSFNPNFSKVNFFSSEEKSNIFSRHKEQIIVGLPIAVIAAIIGAAVGSYITYLLTKS